MKTVDINGIEYNLFDKSSEFTLKTYSEYMEETTVYEKIATKLEGEDLNEVEITRLNIKALKSLAILISKTSTIPYKILEQFSGDQILDFAGKVKHELGDLPLKHKFIFRDASLEEIKKQKRLVESIPVWKPLKKTEEKAKLERMQNTEFCFVDDIGDDSLGQLIEGEEIRMLVKELGEKIKSGRYQYYPKLIALISRPKGEEFNPDMKEVERRERLFQDLPLNLGEMIAGFFLRSAMAFSLNLKTSQKQEQETINTPRQQPKSSL